MGAVIVVLCLVVAVVLATVGIRLVIRAARADEDLNVRSSTVLLLLFGGIAVYLSSSAPFAVAGMIVFTGGVR